MSPASWTILLFTVGVALVIAELFLPAAGVLGLLGALGIIGGVGVCFFISHTLGLIASVLAVASIPGFWLLFVKLYPRTYVGRKTLLPPVESDATPLPVQLGQTGTAVSELRPMGLCDFNGERVEALAERGLLPAGTKVIVISLDDRKPVVRPI